MGAGLGRFGYGWIWVGFQVGWFKRWVDLVWFSLVWFGLDRFGLVLVLVEPAHVWGGSGLGVGVDWGGVDHGLFARD